MSDRHRTTAIRTAGSAGSSSAGYRRFYAWRFI